MTEVTRMRTLMLALAAMALAASPALAADARQQERDKKEYLGARYTQHNPNAADGPEADHAGVRGGHGATFQGVSNANTQDGRLPPHAE